jgi:hypothetical protein
MAGRPEDRLADGRELYVLIEGDEGAYVKALDPDADCCGGAAHPPPTLSISPRRRPGTARPMSEQPPQPPDPDREHSGGDPHHDPTQDAPDVGEQTERETRSERGDDAQDSGTSGTGRR